MIVSLKIAIHFSFTSTCTGHVAVLECERSIISMSTDFFGITNTLINIQKDDKSNKTT